MRGDGRACIGIANVWECLATLLGLRLNGGRILHSGEEVALHCWEGRFYVLRAWAARWSDTHWVLSQSNHPY